MNKKYQQGFSLLEILVVIVIIGILSVFLVPNYMTIRERARDTQRKNDVRQIQKALELYKLDQPTAVYPTSIPAPGTTFQNPATGVQYMRTMPGSPNNYPQAAYEYNTTASGYNLCACLENVADPEGVSCDSCGGFATLCPAGPPAHLCYIVREP